MKVQYPNGVRTEWLDRNPTMIPTCRIAATEGPGSLNDIGKYTVPAGKRAMLTYARGAVTRMVAATVPLHYLLGLIATIGGQAKYILELWANSNIIWERSSEAMNTPVYLAEGDSICWYRQDDSTAGQVAYAGEAFILEFDA